MSNGVEQFAPTQQGVAAIFSYDGRFYAVPLPCEDVAKFEVLHESTPNFPPQDWGELHACKYGSLGGAVDEGETLEAALQREVTEELQSIIDVFLPLAHWPRVQALLAAVFAQDIAFVPAKFSVSQFVYKPVISEGSSTGEMTETSEQVYEWKFRGWFEVTATVIALSDELFLSLLPLLHELQTEEDAQQYRPLLRGLHQQFTQSTAA